MSVDNIFGKQAVIESKEELSQAIENCKTLTETNKLRMAVVKLKDAKTLSLWQKKHRLLRKCPHCGQFYAN